MTPVLLPSSLLPYRGKFLFAPWALFFEKSIPAIEGRTEACKTLLLSMCKISL